MTHARPNLGLVLIIAVLSLVAGGKAIFYDTLDPDCFWHLRVADQLTHNGVGPIVDDISFASIKTPWTPYSWLAELGMKWIWDIAGYRGAVLAQSMMVAGFVVCIALCAAQLQQKPNPMGVIIATIFAMYISLPYLSFRPVTFAILLLSICTWLLLRDRRLDEKTRAVWLIVPLTILIANCHFFAVLVPATVAAILAGSFIEGAPAKRWIKLLALTLGASLATPMLPGMLRSVWDYQFADPMVSGGVIAEFQPIWAGPFGFVSVGILIIWFTLLFTGRRQFRIGEILWAMGAMLLLIRLGRFAPVFAPIAAAVLAARIPEMSETALSSRPVRAAVAFILLIGFVRLFLAFPSKDTPLSAWLNRHGPTVPGYPCGAADFVAHNFRPGRVINEFSWGGYLAWRLGPEYPVFMDGRTQLYTKDFWTDTYLNPRPGHALATSRAQIAILPKENSRFRATLVELGYEPVYHDDRSEVLAHRGLAAAE